MLQSIRDRSHGWLTWLIVLLICITFVLFGVHNYWNEGTANGPAVATVNGTKIPRNLVEIVYERLRQQRQYQLGAAYTINEAVEKQLKSQALNQVVLAMALSQAATNEGYRITKSQVANTLLQIPAFQVNGQFSPQRFRDILNNMLYSEEAFINEMHTTMLINQVRGGYSSSEFALPSDIRASIKLINQKRDIAYTIIPLAKFLKSVHVDDNSAKVYYEQHKDAFKAPEQVSLEYVKLSIPELMAHLTFDDASLQKFYQENIATYSQPQRWRFEQIKLKLPHNTTTQQLEAAQNKMTNFSNRLKQGTSFAQLAKEPTVPDILIQAGDKAIWYVQNGADINLQKALENLSLGQVSNIIRSKDSLSIVKIVAIDKAQVYPFAKVRDQVRKNLAQQKAQELFADTSDRLANLAYSSPGSLEPVAKALGLKIYSTELFTRDGGKDEITANPKVLAAAFSPEVLTQNNNSDVIPISQDAAIVLRVKQHKPAAILPFAQVKDNIYQKLQAEASQQKVIELGKTLLQRLQKGESGLKLAKESSLTWSVLPEAGRYDNRINPIILNEAFRLPRITEKNKLSSTGLALPTGGYAIVAITGVRDGDLTNLPESQQRIFQEEIENARGQLDYQLYVKGIIDKAKIKFNQAESKRAEVNDSGI